MHRDVGSGFRRPFRLRLAAFAVASSCLLVAAPAQSGPRIVQCFNGAWAETWATGSYGVNTFWYQTGMGSAGQNGPSETQQNVNNYLTDWDPMFAYYQALIATYFAAWADGAAWWEANRLLYYATVCPFGG